MTKKISNKQRAAKSRWKKRATLERNKRAELIKQKTYTLPKKNNKTKDFDYLAYKKKAKQSLPKDKIFTHDEYIGVRQSFKAKGQELKAEGIVQRQLQSGYTDKEIDARWKAHNRLFPEKNLTRDEFIKQRAWEEFDNIARAKAAEFKANGMTDQELLAVAWRDIMSPPLRGV